MRTITNNEEALYALDSMRAVADVRDPYLRRKIAIISEGKSPLAYELAADIVENDDQLQAVFGMLACEDGELHEHIFVGHASEGFADEAYRLVLARAKHEPGHMGRRELQRRIGWMLGYDVSDIIAFTKSEIGRTCPCDCCGGKNNVQAPQVDREAHIRRTMYHAK